MTDEEKKELLRAHSVITAMQDQSRTAGMQLIQDGGPDVVYVLMNYMDVMRKRQNDIKEEAVIGLALVGLGECISRLMEEMVEGQIEWRES